MTKQADRAAGRQVESIATYLGRADRRALLRAGTGSLAMACARTHAHECRRG